MRKLVVSEFMSLDGVIEAPQNWHFPYVTDDMMAMVKADLFDNEAYLYGRRTYEEFASYWPSATDDETGIADKLNSTPKYVVTTTLDKGDWQHTTLIKDDVIEQIKALKQQGSGNIGITGSATLIKTLMDAGLIDEYRLMIHPVVVGSGLKLFSEGVEKQGLKLTGSKVFDGGVIRLTYVPEG